MIKAIFESYETVNKRFLNTNTTLLSKIEQRSLLFLIFFKFEFFTFFLFLSIFCILGEKFGRVFYYWCGIFISQHCSAQYSMCCVIIGIWFIMVVVRSCSLEKSCQTHFIAALYPRFLSLPGWRSVSRSKKCSLTFASSAKKIFFFRKVSMLTV